jgi:hypothetical protein
MTFAQAPPRTLAQTVFSLLVDTFVVSGVVWPYLLQASETLAARAARRAGGGGGSSAAGGFSPLTSLVLLSSATLRVLFFACGKRFGLALLYQALASIATQLFVLFLLHPGGAAGAASAGAGAAALRAGPAADDLDDAGEALDDGGVRIASAARRRGGTAAAATGSGGALCPPLTRRAFWRWPDFESYLIVYLGFAFACALLAGAAHPMPAWAVEAVGALALGIEALLPLPQALRNYARRSTAGLSRGLIFAWTAGDTFKIAYAAIKGEPLAFLLCGAFQLLVDLVILAQIAGARAVLAAPPASQLQQLQHAPSARAAAEAQLPAAAAAGAALRSRA